MYSKKEIVRAFCFTTILITAVVSPMVFIIGLLLFLLVSLLIKIISDMMRRRFERRLQILKQKYDAMILMTINGMGYENFRLLKVVSPMDTPLIVDVKNQLCGILKLNSAEVEIIFLEDDFVISDCASTAVVLKQDMKIDVQITEKTTSPR